MVGLPGRSTRRKTMPWPGGAAMQRAVASRPVWRPTPRTSAGAASVRLPVMVGLGGQALELGDDGRHSIERGLGPEKLPMRPGRVSAEAGARRHVAEHRALG